MNLRPLLALSGMLASLSAFACSSAEAPGADGDEGATEQAIVASCTSPRRYFAAVGDGGCAPIAGRRGEWVGDELFADAPEEVRSATCTYRWVAERSSRPDRDALFSRIGWGEGAAPACGAGSFPDIGALEPIAQLDIFGQAGAVGCDVCGLLRRDRVWVVLPPDKVIMREFEVRLSDGTSRAFKIDASRASALSMALPALPAGVSYPPQRIHVY